MLARFGELQPAATARHGRRSRSGAVEIAPVVRALDEAGLLVESLDLVRPTLDDVFVEKTGQTSREPTQAPRRSPSRSPRT